MDPLDRIERVLRNCHSAEAIALEQMSKLAAEDGPGCPSAGEAVSVRAFCERIVRDPEVSRALPVASFLWIVREARRSPQITAHTLEEIISWGNTVCALEPAPLDCTGIAPLVTQAGFLLEDSRTWGIPIGSDDVARRLLEELEALLTAGDAGRSAAPGGS